MRDEAVVKSGCSAVVAAEHFPRGQQGEQTMVRVEGDPSSFSTLQQIRISILFLKMEYLQCEKVALNPAPLTDPSETNLTHRM